MKGTVKYTGGMRFTGISDSGHEVIMDSSESMGGADSAARPLELFLIGLGGCTGVDVVTILRKKHILFTDFTMEFSIDRAPDHPKVFTSISMIYRFTGKNIPLKAVEDAVKLSQGSYCSASAMLRQGATLNYTIEISEG